jgi:hypothetical protein
MAAYSAFTAKSPSIKPTIVDQKGNLCHFGRVSEVVQFALIVAFAPRKDVFSQSENRQ